MEKLGVGLMGCGVMGRSLGTQLNTLENAELRGVADPNPDARAQAATELGATPFDSAEALLAAPGVDAVVIASPGFLHRPLTELAAGQGKHVFVEKPMATNLPDCDAIMSACETAGVTLMVGQVLRYCPCWWQVIELVRQGEIGTPIGIDVTRIGAGFSGIWAQPWRASRELSGGIYMELNSHEIDFMRQIAGEVTRVYAEADHYGDDPADYPNLSYVTFRFESGAVGMLNSSLIAELAENSGRIQGSEGTMIYHGGLGEGGEIRWKHRDKEPQVLPFREIQVEEPVRKELRLFVEAVLQGAPSPISGAEGRRNIAIAEAAYRSAAEGRPVNL